MSVERRTRRRTKKKATRSCIGFIVVISTATTTAIAENAYDELSKL